MVTGILVFLAVMAWLIFSLAILGGQMSMRKDLARIEQRMDVAFRCQRCHFPLKDGDVHGPQVCTVMWQGHYVVIQEASDSC